jgi:NtrC-family two-component system sensor histidine kinase KinB
MRSPSLQTRFLMAGCLIVITTVAGGVWSLAMFARLSTALGTRLRGSQETLELAASLGDILEHEDDALLLALSGKIRNARSEVVQQRQDFDDSYGRLLDRVTDQEEQGAVRSLREHADAYHTVGDQLLKRVGEPGARSQETIDLTAGLANNLEREDDALLLALSENADKARGEVAQQRRAFDQSYSRLAAHLTQPEERDGLLSLRQHADAYRALGDTLLKLSGQPSARETYHQQVNPALRKAVADCDRIRELTFRAIQQLNDIYQQQVNPALRKAVADCGQIRRLTFQSMQQVALEARNETKRATLIVAGIALVALGLSTLVMVLLAQGILRPVQELTRGVEAIRNDDFKYRLRADSDDELGQLAQGFNRMAETLGDYRDSSLGELLAAKATLEATLAALPDAVIVLDPDGRIVSKNPLAAQILKGLNGKETDHFQGLPLPQAVLRDVGNTLRNGQPSSAKPDLSQALSVSINGRSVRVLASVVPIPHFLPKRPGAAIVLADVTEFARLDDLRGEVVAVASHELKTPLTSLQMNLLLLREKSDNLTARQLELLTAAVDGGEELAATIDELLDLTRIEAGQLQLAKQPVDVEALVQQVARTLRSRYEDAEVQLRVVNDAPSSVVEGDPARLRIVFVNLLTNALKYTPRGGEVAIRLASGQNALAGARSKLQITVTDTGPGIPSELRERVFDKFFRVEDLGPNGRKGVRGTGIGLYLCREIIEAHGGTISCQAGDNQHGTRIAVLLDAQSPTA